MGRAGHGKSKSASRTDGITQIPKNKAYSRLSTDSHTYIDGSSSDIMPFVLEVGQSSSRQMNEKPIKKVVTQEMSNEVYSKRRAPSIIAKLMGLEGMPSPRNVHKQQKRLSESYQPNNAFGTTQKGSSMEQLEFKDVYEDLEASHIVNRRCSSRWSSGSMLTKPEMVQIQQKLMDAKRISSEIFQPSKERGDTFGMLNSNKPLSQKFERIPDSSFVNHLQELKVQPPSSLRSHLSALKPLAQAKYGGNAKGLASAREISTKHDTGSLLKREDGLLLDPHNRHRSHFSPNSSKTQLEDKSEKRILPTRIVVLKPNLGKVQSAGTSLSSSDHSYDCVPTFSNMKTHSNFGGEEIVHCRNKFSGYNDELMQSMSKEAREKAQEITRRMKDGCDGTIALMSSAPRGYMGDESSYDDFLSDLDSESEVFKLLSENSLDSNCRYPSYHLVESLADREAKRLSERWKMSQRYQDAQIACGESTLVDLLAKRDRETRPKHLNTKKGFGRASSELGYNNGTSTVDGPLCMERTSDWKDKTNKTSARSKSPPPIDSRKRCHLHDDKNLMQGDILHDHKNLLRIGPLNSRRSKAVKENLSRKEDNLSKCLKPKGRKHVSCYVRSINSSTAHLNIQMEANIEELSKQPPMFQATSNDETYAIPEFDLMKIAECGNLILAQEPSELPSKQASAVRGNQSAYFEQEDSIFQELPQALPKTISPSLQCLGTEMDSSESSKETDHFSPVSVLEVPFTKDMTSTTESFERVGAELRELRKQLQLLKMESGTFIEEEVLQQSPRVCENNCAFGADGWEAAYVLDVLVTSGFKESGIDMFTWHTLESPLDPGLFNILERKYGNDPTFPKHERRMVFDRVSSELLHIFQQHIDRCPWVTPKMAGTDMNVQKEKVRNALEKLKWLKFEYDENSAEEMHKWLYSKIEIDKIGNDIGNMLVDEMIREVIL